MLGPLPIPRLALWCATQLKDLPLAGRVDWLQRNVETEEVGRFAIKVSNGNDSTSYYFSALKHLRKSKCSWHLNFGIRLKTKEQHLLERLMHRSEENCIPELWERWSFQLAKSFIHQIGCDCFDFESTGNLCKLWRPDLVRTFGIHVESDRRGVSCQVFVFVFQDFDTSSMLVEIGKHKMKDDNTDVPNCYSQIKRFDQLIYFFICIYAYMHRDIYLASLDLTPVSE